MHLPFPRAALVFVLLISFSLTLLLLRPSPPSSSPSNNPLVATTIFPLYDMTRSVAGDDVRVLLLLPPGAEPHSFEPTPSVVRELSGASVVYAIGHGLDAWTEDLVDGTSIAMYTVDREVAIRTSTDRALLHEEEEGEEEHGPTDPHYWLDVTNAIQIVRNIEQDLSTRFPEYKDGFSARADAYITQLTDLDARIRATTANTSSKDLITFHDAWYYFASAYGFNVVGTFEPAPGREPTPRDLATLLGTLTSHNIHTLYKEPLFSSAAIDAFVADHDLTTYAIDDIGGTTPETDTYIKLMEWNAEAVSKNR